MFLSDTKSWNSRALPPVASAALLDELPSFSLSAEARACEAEELSTHSYVGADPVNLIDPMGLNAVVPGFEGGWTITAPRLRGGGVIHTSNGTEKFRPRMASENEGGYQPEVPKKEDGQDPKPDSNTVLPSGKTVGDAVRDAINDTLAIGADVTSNTDYAASVASKMAMYTVPRSPLDFKNKYRGRGDPTFLAAAGNFAYGAYVSALAGPSVSSFGAKLYGTVAGWLGLKSSKFLAPNGMSKSGAANVPRGNANAGCPK